MPTHPLALRQLIAMFVLMASISVKLSAQQESSSGRPSEQLLPASSQESSEVISQYKKQRQEENWRRLSNPQEHTDYFDPIKYMPIRDANEWYFSLGSDVRERYELLDHPLWGQGPTDTNGYSMQRYMLHTDIHLGSAVRFFAQIQSALEYGRNGGPRPTDRDSLDLHQAFLDLAIKHDDKNTITLRFGRQELSFGSSRLVSIRDAPNARRSFDGLRLSVKAKQWHIDAFVTKPVETNPGIFDDLPDPTSTFWGLYAIRPWAILPGSNVDLYYLGIDRKDANFSQGTASETRHSVGTRIWGKNRAWDYNYELVYQWGSFGGGDIRAWTVASDDGYTLTKMCFQPRLGLKADITSGDRDLNNANLQTFNALFPKGAYFGEIALIGPSNHMDLHPSVDFKITRKWLLTMESVFFWRESLNDGIYGPAINVLRLPGSSHSRFIGSQLSIQAEWDISRHFSWTGNYSRFFAGPFLRDTGPAEDVHYLTTWLAFRF